MCLPHLKGIEVGEGTGGGERAPLHPDRCCSGRAVWGAEVWAGVSSRCSFDSIDHIDFLGSSLSTLPPAASVSHAVVVVGCSSLCRRHRSMCQISCSVGRILFAFV